MVRDMYTSDKHGSALNNQLKPIMWLSYTIKRISDEMRAVAEIYETKQTSGTLRLRYLSFLLGQGWYYIQKHELHGASHSTDLELGYFIIDSRCLSHLTPTSFAYQLHVAV